MSETGATQQQSRPLGKRLRHGFESKVLVPLAATVVSAATSYLIRKLPMIIEEHVLPRLREPGGAEAMRDAFVEKAEAVVQSAAAIVPDEQASGDGDGGSQGSDEPTAEAETEAKAKAKTSRDGDGSKTADSAESGDEQSSEQREEERRQREERRAERKRSLQKA